MSCDICGENSKPLVDLLDCYKTKTIKQICPECERIVNKKNGEILELIGNIKVNLLQRFMDKLRAKWPR